MNVPVCPRCNRPWHPWSIKRGPRCSPDGWKHCVRDEDQEYVRQAMRIMETQA